MRLSLQRYNKICYATTKYKKKWEGKGVSNPWRSMNVFVLRHDRQSYCGMDALILRYGSRQTSEPCYANRSTLAEALLYRAFRGIAPYPPHHTLTA